jgi:hypothetical protein
MTCYDPRLNEMFAENFQPHELSKAQEWYDQWVSRGQVMPWCTSRCADRTDSPVCIDCVYSMRVMAGFLSDYLEQAEPGKSENIIHWDTKYGSLLYFGDLSDSYLDKEKQ